MISAQKSPDQPQVRTVCSDLGNVDTSPLRSDAEQPRLAMGLVNAAVSHRDHRPRDLQAIESIALERDYILIDVLTVTPATYMPTSVIAFEALARSAVAVVAPSIAHFGGHAATLAHVVTLETWSGSIPRIVRDSHPGSPATAAQAR